MLIDISANNGTDMINIGIDTPTAVPIRPFEYFLMKFIGYSSSKAVSHLFASSCETLTFSILFKLMR